jgi:hypothetical protein
LTAVICSQQHLILICGKHGCMEQTWLQNHTKLQDGIRTIIKEMIKEKGYTCVSIIVPTHRFGQNRIVDLRNVQRAIFAAKQKVQYEYGNLLMRIDDLFSQIDFKKNKEGIGIFVSSHLKQIVKFPFPVTKKIVVNNFFHLHDLLYIENYQTNYYLLDISKNKIHLFRGVMDHLEEINETYFPKHISYKYRDNEAGSNGVLEKTLRIADKYISKLLGSADVPLILCGAEEDIAVYKSVTGCQENIIGSITDNYTKTELDDLEVLAWLQMQSFIDKQKRKIIGGLKKKIVAGFAVCGIEEVWKASKEEANVTLLVEKNYSRAAFVTPDNQLNLHRPAKQHGRYADAVNEIMTTVLQKNGKVIIAEKDDLKNYKRIVLIRND